MRKIIICCLVALFLPFLMSTNTYAEEIESIEEQEIVDFSGASLDGSSDVSIKQLPVYPENEEGYTIDSWLPDFLSRFNGVFFAPTWSSIVNGPNASQQESTNLMVRAVQLLTAGVPLIIGLVFFWWGLRKVAGAIMSAFKKGKLRI